MRYPARIFSPKQATAILVLGIMTLAASAQKTPAASAKETPVHHETAATTTWRTSLLKHHSTALGCSEAVFPSATWKPASCGPARKPDITPRPRPLDDEKASGDFALVSPTAITLASGSLWRIQNVSSVLGFSNKQNVFSLQINTNRNFAPGSSVPLCAGSTSAACHGWLQFVYDSGGTIFVQAWALSYGPQTTLTCPSNFQFTDTTTGSCGLNTATFTLPPPLLTLQDLAGAVLTGQIFNDASGKSFDEVTLTVNGHAYKTNAAPDVVGASGNWSTAEFNVFGESGRDQSVFNSGSLLSVQLLVNNGTGSGSTCSGPGAGDTGETTNLTLSPNCIAGGAYIEFDEGVAPIIQSISPTSGSAGGGTQVTITAATTNPNGTLVVNGFDPLPIVRFGNNVATGAVCSTTTCTAFAPQGEGSQPVTVANIFQGGSPGIFSPTKNAPQFSYVGPAGCSLTLLGCPAGGGDQQYQVSCPSTVNFLVDGQFQQTGTLFLGSEAGKFTTLGVSACIPNTSNCQLFTTTETQSCPIKGGGGGGGVTPIKNCQVCADGGQQCVKIPGGFKCVGTAR